MVDVSAKAITQRVAVAEGRVRMRAETLARIVDGTLPKGDVLATARIAGIMAAKQTPLLVPLCHPLALGSVQVDLAPETDGRGIAIRARVGVAGRTGGEIGDAHGTASVRAWAARRRGNLSGRFYPADRRRPLRVAGEPGIEVVQQGAAIRAKHAAHQQFRQGRLVLRMAGQIGCV